MRNVLTRVSKASSAMPTSRSRPRYAPSSPNHRPAGAWAAEVVATILEPKLPEVATTFREPREEITAFADFPETHRPKIRSTSPLERLDREVTWRIQVVGVVPRPAALYRLTACVLNEAHDGLQVTKRRYLS